MTIVRLQSTQVHATNGPQNHDVCGTASHDPPAQPTAPAALQICSPRSAFDFYASRASACRITVRVRPHSASAAPHKLRPRAVALDASATPMRPDRSNPRCRRSYCCSLPQRVMGGHCSGLSVFGGTLTHKPGECQSSQSLFDLFASRPSSSADTRRVIGT